MTVFSYRRSTPLLIAVLISAVCVWSAWGVPLSPGTLGVQNKDNVTITGGSITGITDIAIADGGTGASTAANARTNLGLDNASNYPAGLLRTDGSAASLTSFPTLNQNTTGTASNVSGTPALPNGTTATSQSAHDNGTKLATTRYVDGRDQFYRFNIDAPAVTDNVMFDGPLFVGITLDNVVFVVTDNTGKRSGASTDNVTVNIIYCGAADNTVAQCTKVFTSDQTPTGAAVLTPALNNTTPGTGNYLRFYVAATNMTNKKLYVRIRYRE